MTDWINDLPPNLGCDERMFVAAVAALIGRTGSDQFQIRYCDEEDPTVWIAAAHWSERAVDERMLVPEHWDSCAGMTPWRAVFRLCEATMDGGTCRHCDRPTAVDDKAADKWLVETEGLICWYRFDPELNTFRRGCEGQAE